jgi:hypothetical protein
VENFLLPGWQNSIWKTALAEARPGRSGEFLITWQAELYLEDTPGRGQTWQMWRISDYLADRTLSGNW